MLGATNRVLALDNVSLFDNGEYDVVVSNPRGSMISQPVTLAVMVSAPTHASIRVEPTNRVAFIGGTAVLAAHAEGSPPMGYRWLLENQPIPNARESILRLEPLTLRRVCHWKYSSRLKYRSPVSQSTVTTCLPAPSSRATRPATCTLAPALIPTKSPSCFARRRLDS